MNNIKMLLITMAVFGSIPLSYGQNQPDKDWHMMLDADSLSLLRIDSTNNASYFLITEKTVSSAIEFDGGPKALDRFCDSLFFQRFPEADYPVAGAYYAILFDSSLEIVDVRIMKRVLYDNLKFNYDEVIKNILFQTQGKWHKTSNPGNNNKNLWYYTLGHFKIRWLH